MRLDNNGHSKTRASEQDPTGITATSVTLPLNN